MPAVLKPGQLTEQQFRQFFEEVTYAVSFDILVKDWSVTVSSVNYA